MDCIPGLTTRNTEDWFRYFLQRGFVETYGSFPSESDIENSVDNLLAVLLISRMRGPYRDAADEYEQYHENSPMYRQYILEPGYVAYSTEQLIKANPQAVADYHAGKANALSMRRTGSAIVRASLPDFRHYVFRAAAALKGPVYVRLGRNKVPTIFDDSYRFEIGKGAELAPGTDLTFITTGLMTAQALEAAALLKNEGVSARVVHLATIKPLDGEIVLKAARETGAIVTAEEHSVVGGLGGAVSEFLAENCPTPLKRVGVNDRFGTSGKAEELLKYFGLTPQDLAQAARELLQKK